MEEEKEMSERIRRTGAFVAGAKINGIVPPAVSLLREVDAGRSSQRHDEKEHIRQSGRCGRPDDPKCNEPRDSVRSD